jgi:Ni,Fe-hydrogenase III large subunit/Ni,Fe-hydrogenase III component G
MALSGLGLAARRLAGAVPVSIATVDRSQWIRAARVAREGAGRIVALWGSDNRDRNAAFSVHAAYATHSGLIVLELPVAADALAYPSIGEAFPGALRMQRALGDLLGLKADGAGDHRPWLRHGAWREDEFPLRRDFDESAARENAPDAYPFVRVEGDGVHEIAVGPIHAGVIEPGHFRFSVVGEKVLRLEERMGYTHKGIDRRFADHTIATGHRLAGRVCGDSTVAFAWAYAQAAESLLAVEPPPRAAWIRALMLERERVANHLGDLGALGNDAALAFALTQFTRLREDWLRASHEAFGHRLMMDRIVPGGVDCDLRHESVERLVRQADAIEAEVRRFQDVFDEHSGLQDRFITAGRVSAELARALGLAGLAGRASGQSFDLRSDFPCSPYDRLAVRSVVHANGDVAARVKVRFDELYESMRLIRELLATMPAGATRAALPDAAPGSVGFGWLEGWRGEVFVALEAGDSNRIRRGHAHDPSWQAWPVIEHAVIGNIVPDFPLINKSFNLSYSGEDC